MIATITINVPDFWVGVIVGAIAMFAVLLVISKSSGDSGKQL